MPLYALFAHGFGIEPKTIAFIWSGYSLATAAFILLMGKLENTMNKGRVITIGYIIYALGALSFLMVHSKEALIIALTFNALGAGVTLLRIDHARQEAVAVCCAESGPAISTNLRRTTKIGSYST